MQTSPVPAPAQSQAARGTWAVQVMVTLTSFMIPFTSSAVNVAIPPIGLEFHLDPGTLGWVAMSFLLAAAIFQVPFGRLGDIYGRKKVFLAGNIAFTIISLVLSMVPSASALIGLRVAQGIAGAAQFSTGIAIVTSVMPPQAKGRALGINTAAVYTGLSIGPVIGGYLTETFGWRSAFLTAVPLSLAAMTILLLRVKGDWSEAKGERFDLPGALVFGVMMVSLMYGFYRLPGWEGVGLIVFGLAMFAGFVIWERRAIHPVLNVRLFTQNWTFAFSNLAALINYSATFAVGFIMSLYLQYVKELGPRDAGLVLLVQPVLMTIFSPLAGRASDRIEPRIVASVGMGLSTVGLAMYIFLTDSTPMAYIIAGMAVFGLGFGLFSSPNTNAVMSSVERRYFGVAAASLGTMRSTGQMLGVGIATVVLSVIMGQVTVSRAVFPQFDLAIRVMFIIYFFLSLGGLAASLKRGKVR